MTAATHGRSGRPWRRLREQVLREEPYCQIRGPKCSRIATTVDHIVPLSIDPSQAHVRSNLRGACGPCNYGSGAVLGNRMRDGFRPPAPPSRSRFVPVAKECPCAQFCAPLATGQALPASCYGITARKL